MSLISERESPNSLTPSRCENLDDEKGEELDDEKGEEELEDS